MELASKAGKHSGTIVRALRRECRVTPLRLVNRRIIASRIVFEILLGALHWFLWKVNGSGVRCWFQGIVSLDR